MCGFEFDRADTLCSHACPLGALCRMVRCPACEYEFDETREPPSGSWWDALKRLWPGGPSRRVEGTAGAARDEGATDRREDPDSASGGPEGPDGPRPAGLEEVRPVTTVRPGERVEVLCLGREAGSRARSLAVFGLLPGARVRVLQQRPATVLRVDETELALDREIAREILVRPARRAGDGEADDGEAAEDGGPSPRHPAPLRARAVSPETAASPGA